MILAAVVFARVNWATSLSKSSQMDVVGGLDDADDLLSMGIASDSHSCALLPLPTFCFKLFRAFLNFWLLLKAFLLNLESKMVASVYKTWDSMNKIIFEFLYDSQGSIIIGSLNRAPIFNEINLHKGITLDNVFFSAYLASNIWKCL